MQFITRALTGIKNTLRMNIAYRPVLSSAWCKLCSVPEQSLSENKRAPLACKEHYLGRQEEAALALCFCKADSSSKKHPEEPLWNPPLNRKYSCNLKFLDEETCWDFDEIVLNPYTARGVWHLCARGFFLIFTVKCYKYSSNCCLTVYGFKVILYT